MTRKNMIKKLAFQMDITATKAEEIFNQVIGIIREGIVDSDKLSVNGLGSFHKRLMENRKGYNPATKEVMEVPVYTAVTFRASKSLKESI